jgi:hypothetical protein
VVQYDDTVPYPAQPGWGSQRGRSTSAKAKKWQCKAIESKGKEGKEKQMIKDKRQNTKKKEGSRVQNNLPPLLKDRN